MTRAEAQAESERRYPKQPPNPPQPLNMHTIMRAVFIEGWMACAEWRDAQVEALLERITESAQAALDNLYQCTDDCNDRDRAMARLTEIYVLASRTLQDEGEDGG